MAQKLETMTREAATQNLSFAAALERLADLELEARHGRAIERRNLPEQNLVFGNAVVRPRRDIPAT